MLGPEYQQESPTSSVIKISSKSGHNGVVPTSLMLLIPSDIAAGLRTDNFQLRK